MNDNIIDIMVTIDVDTILNSQGKQFDSGQTFNLQKSDPTQPSHLYNFTTGGVRLSSQAIYMVARRNNAPVGEGTDELSVNLKEGDLIHWRSTSLSEGLYHTVLLYQYTQTSPVVTQQNPNYVQDITPVVLNHTPMPIINQSNPSAQPIAQSVKNFYWEGRAVRQGSITYTWAFMIVDSDNQVVGYCDWDPYININ
ncbi:AidA/PixA family protein [Pseudomonas protegens]|uniref:Inclusion body protein n=2 Tax=Pseudomonas TaxID=286 RepID=A0A9Q6N5K1_9PSED|nr:MULTISPECIES: AidA/PixA family protein [Pseudomonas]MBS7562163.1 inclusion body family protein [Pseudomonas sp. RC4D1]MCO7579870.1 inclusion body family protein [Pseudomonas protegens]MCO7585912.1 inclusion body family protein [Pseudomonas chlororaphis]MCO7603066.1 inclusion body family protein [Pseudomonas chlororaphis]MCY7263957.1 inclusion body family protein [Pseudomonas protegens]